MIREQLLIRGDSADSVYTAWIPSRGESARCLVKLVSGSVSGTGKFKWTVETKNSEDLDSAATTAVSQLYATSAKAARLDTASSSVTTDPMSYSVSSGTDRALIVAYTTEQTNPPTPTVTYGGQSMTQIADVNVGDFPTDLRCTLFWLNDAGITAASGTNIDLTGQGGNYTVHAASYSGVSQIAPVVVDKDAVSASTNPLTSVTIPSVDGGAVCCIAASGAAGTASWGGTVPLTEQTEQNTGIHGASFADRLSTATETANCECTWSFTPNRSIAIALLLEPAYAGVKEAETTSGVKELYRYKFSLDANASEGDFVWYQYMEPIWQPTYA